jgi:hypothetical protein
LIVSFDASILVYVIDAKANAPIDQATGAPVDRCQERVTYLLKRLQDNGDKIIIPTPALAEVLVKAGKNGPELLRIINSSKFFKIVPFDERASVEFAATQIERASTGQKSGAPSKAKAKFDDQIVSISAIEGVEEIYSDDGDVARLAGARFKTTKIVELPLPPEDPQGNLLLEKAPD